MTAEHETRRVAAQAHYSGALRAPEDRVTRQS